MRRSTPIALALLFSFASAAEAADRAGVSAAVTGSVSLTRDTKQIVGQQVASGEEIFLSDQIASSAKSGMQILLLDETVFTIGPDSTIVIDKFVYDPTTNAGEVSAEVVKGVFRFVTGRVAARKPSAMNVKLPVGNIGIRGTMVGGIVRPDGSAVVFLLGAGPNNNVGEDPGAIIATNAGVSEWIRTPGWGVELYPGEPPRVIRVDPALIQQVTAQINDPQGRDGTGEGQEVVWFQETSPSEDSGDSTAEGGPASDTTLLLIEESDNLTDAIDDVIELGLLPGRQLATVDQLLAVPTGASFYDGAAPLSDGGSYDFQITLDFDIQQVFTDFFNINSPTLGLAGEFSFGNEDISNGIDGNADYQIDGSPIGVGNCAAQGCTVDIDLRFFDAASPPQSADHQLLIHDMSGAVPDVLGGAIGTPGMVGEGQEEPEF